MLLNFGTWIKPQKCESVNATNVHQVLAQCDFWDWEKVALSEFCTK